MFVNCINRRQIPLWARRELRKFGTTTEMEKAIRGDFGPRASNKKAMLLVLVAIDSIWRARGEGRVPTINRIKYEWEKEKRSRNEQT